MDGVEAVLSELEESCTISILTDVSSSSSIENAGDVSRASESQSNVNAILNSMRRTLSTSLETRVSYHYELVVSTVVNCNKLHVCWCLSDMLKLHLGYWLVSSCSQLQIYSYYYLYITSMYNFIVHFIVISGFATIAILRADD